MLQKIPGKSSATPGRISSPDPRRGQRPSHPVDGEIMELLEFLRRAAPITDVRFVPHFPIPRFHLGLAVFIDRVFGPLKGQLAPLRVISLRVSPARENLVIPRSRRPMVLVRL